MRSLQRRWHAIAAAWIAAVVVLAPAAAQAPYPARPIRIIVPFSTGTGIDVLARIVGAKLADRFGVAVVVDNRPGASGNIGTDAVARSAPDGYTLLMTATSFVTNTALQPGLPYDPSRSFTPIGLVAIGSLALVVHPSVPARSVQELAALARAQPGKLNFASPGTGTPHHLAMELLKVHFGVNLAHVPYKGSAGAVSDLLGGQVQAMFLPVHIALVHAQAGQLRMLASGGARRSPVTPDVPSLTDEGIAEIDVDIWYGILAPAGMPRGQATLLNVEVNAILAAPDVRESMSKQGFDPTIGTPDDLARTIDTGLVRWTKIVRDAGLRGG